MPRFSLGSLLPSWELLRSTANFNIWSIIWQWGKDFGGCLRRSFSFFAKGVSRIPHTAINQHKKIGNRIGGDG
jgi:hypothetical protein